MALRTLFGQVANGPKKLPRKLRSPERVQQSIDAFGLHLQGVSYRGIAEHFGWASPNTAVNSVRRGENICKELSLDTDRIRLKLAAACDELADITIAEVKKQALEGRLLTIKTKDGIELRHSAGVDPRMIAEASEGLMRFAEFAGLTDRAPEVNHQAVTMVNLTAPTDGVAFSAKWAEPCSKSPSMHAKLHTHP